MHAQEADVHPGVGLTVPLPPSLVSEDVSAQSVLHLSDLAADVVPDREVLQRQRLQREGASVGEDVFHQGLRSHQVSTIDGAVQTRLKDRVKENRVVAL